MESDIFAIVIIAVLISLVIIPVAITLIYQLLKHRCLSRAPPLRPMPPSPPWSGILPRRPATPVPHDSYVHTSRAPSPVSILEQRPITSPSERRLSTSVNRQEGGALEGQRTYASIELARVPKLGSEDDAQNLEFERKVDEINGSRRVFF
jgi:hypothetical protein